MGNTQCCRSETGGESGMEPALVQNCPLFESRALELWSHYDAALKDSDGAEQADGIAHTHTNHARDEAATKLIGNHTALVLDIIGSPSKSNGQAAEAKHVHSNNKPYVDWMLREAARRLLGNRKGLRELAEKPDGTDTEQAKAWRGCAVYLEFSKKGLEFPMPGGGPAMSSQARAAFLAVIQELAMEAEVSHPMWASLEKALTDSAGSEKAEGVASKFQQADRLAAAKKLISNHRAVICDVTNPSKEFNVYGYILTQFELERVDIGSKVHIDQMFRECTRRLLGHCGGMEKLGKKPDPKDPHRAVQAKAYRGCETYLKTRLQSKLDQKPGREPDLSESANAAFMAVLDEMAGEAEAAAK